MSEVVQTSAQAATGLAGNHPALRFHPVIPPPSPADWAEGMRTPEGQALLVAYLNKRGRLLELMERDPLRHGAELEHWKDADRLLAELIQVLIMLGGNRSGKSEFCAKRAVQASVKYPWNNLLCLAEDLQTSKETQQALIWKYLPPELRALNRKQDPGGTFKINYSEAGGFTEQLLVLPNHSKIHFKSYNQEAAECEGWEFGNKLALAIGGWADESLRLPWLRMMIRRFEFRPAQLLWSFTPILGMTPTIKECVGESAKTLESRTAELLPQNRVHVPGVPAGEMPYIQEPILPRARVIYFFSHMNPFGVTARRPTGEEYYRTYYEGVKAVCEGKPSDYVARIAYGYTRDTSGKAFPNFCAVNVIKRWHLPKVGTNYHLMDPATARNWAMLWLRVTPGRNPDFYIYRDWPDMQRFGEWAVPTEREVSDTQRRGLDGDAGPAQKRVLGYGVVEYKRAIVQCESFLGSSVLGNEGKEDPQRVDLAKARGGMREAAAGEEMEPGKKAPEAWLREEIFRRLVDPRAGNDPKIQEIGGKTIIDMFGERQEVKTRTELERQALEPMWLEEASGVELDRGHTAINDLLRFDQTEPVVPLMNCPRLFVCEDCHQVRWALENYTGLAGESGACKDFVDLVRYAAVSDLRYVEPGGRVKVRGGGSY